MISEMQCVFVCALHIIHLFKSAFSPLSQVLTSLVPSLIGHLSDASLNDALLTVLVDVARVSPASLRPFLPALRIMGQQTPGQLGHVAKIHGTVGLVTEVSSEHRIVIHTIILKMNTRILSAVILLEMK